MCGGGMAGKIIDPLGVHNVIGDIAHGNFGSDKAQPIDYLAIGPFASSRTGREVGRAGAIAYGASALLGAAGAATAGAGADTATPIAGAGAAGAAGGAAGGAAASGAAGAGTAGAASSGLSFGSLLGYAKTAATILGPVASVMSAASGINAAKQMAKVAGTPQVPSPVTMPIFGSGQTQMSMQDEAAVQAARRGRAATILTAPSGERLGS